MKVNWDVFQGRVHMFLGAIRINKEFELLGVQITMGTIIWSNQETFVLVNCHYLTVIKLWKVISKTFERIVVLWNDVVSFDPHLHVSFLTLGSLDPGFIHIFPKKPHNTIISILGQGQGRYHLRCRGDHRDDKVL
jgi:hypothetical protein